MAIQVVEQQNDKLDLKLEFDSREKFQKQIENMTKDYQNYQQLQIFQIKAINLGLNDDDLSLLIKFLVKLEKLTHLKLELQQNKIKNFKNFSQIKFSLESLNLNFSGNKLETFKIQLSILRQSSDLKEIYIDLQDNKKLQPNQYLNILSAKLQKSFYLQKFYLYINGTDISEDEESNEYDKQEILQIQKEIQEIVKKTTYLNCFQVDVLQIECCPLQDGFFINFANKTCDKCYDSHCIKCFQDKYTCIRCNEEYYLLDINCRTQCPYGYMPSENDNICIPIEKIINYEIADNESFITFVNENIQYMEFIQEIYLYGAENFQFNWQGQQALKELFALENGLPDLFILEFYFDSNKLQEIDQVLSQILSSCYNLKSANFYFKNNNIDNFQHTMNQLAKLQTVNILDIQLKGNPLDSKEILKQYMDFIKQNKSIQFIQIDILDVHCQIYNKQTNEYKYHDSEQTYVNNCNACSESCGRCYSKYRCLTCQSSDEYVYKGKCVTTCPNGYFQNKKDKTCEELQPSYIQQIITNQQDFNNFLSTFQPNTVVNLKSLSIFIQYHKNICYQDQIDYMGNIFSSLDFPMMQILDITCDRCQINNLTILAQGIKNFNKLNELFLNLQNNQLQTEDIVNILNSLQEMQKLQNLFILLSNNIVGNNTQNQLIHQKDYGNNINMEQVNEAYKEAIRYKDYLTFIQFDLIQANCQLQQQVDGHIYYYFPNIQEQGKCQQCPKDCSRCFDQQICFSCLNEQLVQEDTNKCFQQCPSGFKKLENYDVCTNKDFKDENHSNIKYILFYASAGLVLVLLIALIIIMVIKIKNLKQSKLEQSQEQSNNILKYDVGIKSELLQSDQIGINDEFDQENQQKLIKQNQQMFNQNNSNQCNTSKSQNSNRTNNSNKIIQSLNKSNNSINSSKFPENQLVIHNQFNIFSSLYNDKVEIPDTLCSLEQDLQNPKIFWSSQKFNNKFQFISLLGQGTYGKVYKYYDKEKKQQIAIKEIQMAGDLQQIIKKEAYNEINNLKKIQNIPNIVQLIQYYILEIDNKKLLQNEIQKIKEENVDEKEIEYCTQDKNSSINIQDQSSQSSSCYFSDSDSEEQENICFKMMICLELGQNSLENFILRQKQKVKKLFSQKVILQIMTDITKACYDLQVITNFAHRDIKPKNILFANQKWKLCDFGSAKNLGKQVKQFEKLKKTMTRKNTMIGTVNYLSPEQKTNYVLNALQEQENPINPFKSDVFSLGITFFEVLTLGNINGINDRSDLLQMKIKINLNSKNDIYDKRIIQTVIQMLSWDPDQRPSFKEIFNDLSKII